MQSVPFFFFSLALKIRKQATNNFCLSFHNEHSVSYLRLAFVFFFKTFLLNVIPLIINLIKHTSPQAKVQEQNVGINVLLGNLSSSQIHRCSNKHAEFGPFLG